jgi:hypothetical protein
MLSKDKSLMRKFVVAVLVAGVSVSVAQIRDARAHGENEHENHRLAVSDPKLKEDCGACHVVYPPDMLPAESWRAIMAGLDKHFGSNASLDAAAVNEITAFLEKNADTGKKSHEAPGKNETMAKPLLRITETGRFKSEHREVAARHWKNPKVKSPSNCGACHTKAEEGDYNERYVKIPK